MATLFDAGQKQPAAEPAVGPSDAMRALKTERARLYREMWDALRNLKLHKTAFRNHKRDLDRKQMEKWEGRVDEVRKQVAEVNRRIRSRDSIAVRGES